MNIILESDASLSFQYALLSLVAFRVLLIKYIMVCGFYVTNCEKVKKLFCIACKKKQNAPTLTAKVQDSSFFWWFNISAVFQRALPVRFRARCDLCIQVGVRLRRDPFRPGDSPPSCPEPSEVLLSSLLISVSAVPRPHRSVSPAEQPGSLSYSPAVFPSRFFSVPVSTRQ